MGIRTVLVTVVSGCAVTAIGMVLRVAGRLGGPATRATHRTLPPTAAGCVMGAFSATAGSARA